MWKDKGYDHLDRISFKNNCLKRNILRIYSKIEKYLV